MGRDTWYYSLGVSSIIDAFVRSEFGISSWRGSRVDGRSYLLSGAIDDSEANRIICDSKSEFENSQKQEVWNDCRSCKVRVGSNGNLLWEASVLLGRKMRNGHVEVTAMPFGLTNAPAVFMELMSRSKEEYESHVKMIVESLKEEKMYVKFSNNVEAEQRGSYLDVEGINWVMSRSWEKVIACASRQLKVLMMDCMTNVMLYRGVGRRSEAKNEFEIDVRRSDLEMESGSYWLDKVRTSIWRDVRTLAIEEAYTTKYSIHPGADTMLCGFRLTNRWLSMKKDIASCGSKYLAYLEVEVEYQGSSGLLLQPETSMVDFRGNWNTHFREMSFSLRWGLSFEYGCASFEAWYGKELLMPRVVKSRDEIFSRWGYCDNHDLSRLDNQSIERDRLIGIGLVLNFVKFISFTFGDKEMIIEILTFCVKCIIREVFVKLLLDSFGKLSIRVMDYPGQPATDNSPAVPARTIPKTFSNISPKDKPHYDAEAEAILLILTEIRNEIYSTVDACKTAHDVWIAIERLQQGESLNKQDVKTSLFWEFGRFTSRDGE
ncbi:hypothetical protein Tco_1123307 [Tanacetum coccineum]|uniref:Uncharacterized protein n=1 Tax=Tanacetum coccineum TaxID=301880 RepID=A0ABQ5J2Z3_9ASTR